MLSRGLLFSAALLLLTGAQLIYAAPHGGDEQKSPKDSFEPLALLAEAGLELEELTLTLKLVKHQPDDPEVEPCIWTRCKNGGSCNGPTGACFCSLNYYGRFCQHVRLCSDVFKCQNGGTCNSNGTCVCAKRYGNYFCEFDKKGE